MVKLYEHGATQQQIAEAFGITQSSVSILFKNNHVKTRNIADYYGEEGRAAYLKKIIQRQLEGH